MKIRRRFRVLDRLRRNTAVAILAGLSLAMPAAAQAPPDEDWRTIDTSHFRVTFPEGLEDLARRTATHAERIHGALAASFLQAPEGLQSTSCSRTMPTRWPDQRSTGRPAAS